MRISDWSSDVCSSDLWLRRHHGDHLGLRASLPRPRAATRTVIIRDTGAVTRHGSSTPIPGAALRPEADTLALALPKSRRQTPKIRLSQFRRPLSRRKSSRSAPRSVCFWTALGYPVRSEEHTSELQSLMRISYA